MNLRRLVRGSKVSSLAMLLATRCGLLLGSCLKLAPNFARRLALSVQQKYRHVIPAVEGNQGGSRKASCNVWCASHHSSEPSRAFSHLKDERLVAKAFTARKAGTQQPSPSQAGRGPLAPSSISFRLAISR
jgi:hypothetical protein